MQNNQAAVKNELVEKLNEKLARCPLFSDCFGSSLRQRVNTPHWFENRFLQAIYGGTDWIEEHEQFLQHTDIQEVKNADKIFSDLKGDDPDYDLKIFDVLAEVRLIRWARENGYIDIEKLIVDGQSTPDFLMKKGQEGTIAEAKYFRPRDYLKDFVEDRLKGLVLKTTCLNQFGISLDTTDKYEEIHDFLLKTRKYCEIGYRKAIRDELTEEWLIALESELCENPEIEKKVFCDLFLARRTKTLGIASIMLFWQNASNEKGAAKLMLEKLCGNLMAALKQIRSYTDRNLFVDIPSAALVFLSGTDECSLEWENMWETLKCKDSWAKVQEIYSKASELIKLPFELIVGKYKEEQSEFAGRQATKKTLEYVPFPWTPKTN